MSKTGRHYFTANGRTFFIEPIMPNATYKGKGWGDVDPASGKVTGGYGNKHRGAITEDESVITKENGFKNIFNLPAGVSPYSFIQSLVK
jgi:hypothetical protein